MSVKQEDLVLDGFPKWVVKLMDDCTIHIQDSPAPSAKLHATVFVPKAKYERSADLVLDERFGYDPDHATAISRFRASLTRQAACAIWESRDRHGKVLPC